MLMRRRMQHSWHSRYGCAYSRLRPSAPKPLRSGRRDGPIRRERCGEADAGQFDHLVAVRYHRYRIPGAARPGGTPVPASECCAGPAPRPAPRSRRSCQRCAWSVPPRTRGKHSSYIRRLGGPRVPFCVVVDGGGGASAPTRRGPTTEEPSSCFQDQTRTARDGRNRHRAPFQLQDPTRPCLVC